MEEPKDQKQEDKISQVVAEAVIQPEQHVQATHPWTDPVVNEISQDGKGWWRHHQDM